MKRYEADTCFPGADTGHRQMNKKNPAKSFNKVPDQQLPGPDGRQNG